MSLLHAAIIAPFLCAAAVPLLYKYIRRVHTGWFVLIVPVVLFIALLTLLPQVQQGPVAHELPWIPSLGIQFTVHLDGLSMLFALLISGIGSLVVLYSIFYLSRKKEAIHHFYVYLLLFMGAMLGVVLSDNMVVLYTFWELTSISSFLLIAYWNERERSRYGALKSMLITVFGGFAMLTGIILLRLMTGTFSIREVIGQLDAVQAHAWFIPAMLLFLLGAFTKSAQFPFHIWLPDAMEAPTPVSAYLHSATMVKAGIYLAARFTPVFGGDPVWFWLVGGIGLLTLIAGSFNAVRQTDLKGILAYSTISQLGLIMCLLGLGSAALYNAGGESSQLYMMAVTAAVFHLINHATFKGALFMVAGIVDHETGTRDIRKLGGLASLMPITFTFALIGTFSMAGLPPFNGFLSKEMFFTGVLNASKMELFSMQTWGMLFPVIAWLASVFTFVYSMMFVFRTFTGKLQLDKLEKKPHEAPLGLLISPAVLVSLVIVFGLFPNLLSHSLIEPAMAAILPSLIDASSEYQVHISFWHGWTTELYMTIGVVLIGTLLVITLSKWQVIYRLLPEKLSFHTVYDRFLALLDKLSGRITRLYMTGSLRDYLAYIFVFLVVVLGGLWYRSGAWNWTTAGDAPIAVYEWILAGALALTAIIVPFSRSRITMILLSGAAGYIVTLFFVIFRAPDLALTQMIVETVSVALFLLCFYHLPKLKKELSTIRFRLRNLLISLGVGTVFTFIALSVNSRGSTPSIKDYFVENSYKLAGGKNVVNVILVDFRGFDTLLEIMVLGIASLGIFALIKLRLSRKKAEQQAASGLEGGKPHES